MTRAVRRSSPLSIAVLLCAACTQGPAQPRPTLPDDAEQALRTVERRLIEAASVRFESSATAEGVVTADLTGTVEFRGAEVTLRHQGVFVDRKVDLHLGFDGDRLAGGNGEHRFERERPSALREAMMLGLTRMGILHNLARLAGARAPDHADGDVEPWLGMRDVRWGEQRSSDGGPLRAVEFELLVDDQPAADVRLWLDPIRALPMEREQVVAFPQGEMRVTERYRDWEIDPPSEP